MGNCQAIDAASLVIQHPNGRVERYYWPLTVGEVMRMNQGHYVALVVTLGRLSSASDQQEKAAGNNRVPTGVRFTRVKLLKPTETLVLGQSYRLITSEDVMKGLWEKKYAKMKKKKELESSEKPAHRELEIKDSGREMEERSSQPEIINEAIKSERHRQKTASSSSLPRSRHWRPSLQSISESTS
ncbi:hypothetical protein ACHQM5_006988 [Ranunculus cassubicifolius]